MFLISKAGFKFGYREMMEMPSRKLRRFYDLSVTYFEEQEKKRKEASKNN
jgi:hypothetical protein